MALLGGILFAVVGSSVFFGCGMYTLTTWSTMVDRVNERLPAEQRFDSLWWGPGKRAALIREYQRLYPGGPLLRRSYIALAIGLGSGAITVMVLDHWAER